MAVEPISGLRIREKDLASLRAVLFPGDNKEAVAFALCGLSQGPFGKQLLVREVIPLSSSAYRNRSGVEVTWNTVDLLPLLYRVEQEGLSLVKCHSHPSGIAAFSSLDDESDRNLLPHCYEWNPQGLHGSLVLTESNVVGRIVNEVGRFQPLESIRVVGSQLRSLINPLATPLDEAQRRLVQAFGEGTYTELAGLRVGVVGASGTGSLVIEALVRTGVRHIVIIDPEAVEDVNLNRIVHSTHEDVTAGRQKTAVAADAIRSIGFDIEVTEIVGTLHDPSVIRALAGCDVVMGCVDNREGRQILCRIAAFYLLPYIDTGVAIHADEHTGEILSVNTGIHYFEPGQSFIARKVFSAEALREEVMAATDPDHHAKQVRAGYVAGVDVEKPAVMPLNMIAAGLAVNELLTRIHGYREGDGEGLSAETFFSVDLGFARHGTDTGLCPALAPHIGQGDCVPLLGLPALTEKEEAA